MERCMDMMRIIPDSFELKAQREEMELASQRKRQSILRMELNGRSVDAVRERQSRRQDWNVWKR